MEQKEKYTETNSSYHEDNGGCQKVGFSEMISKPEFNFWIPIIFTAVTISMSFMSVKGQVDLQNQKLDTLIAQQTTILQKYEAVQARLGTAERQISILVYNDEHKE